MGCCLLNVRNQQMHMVIPLFIDCKMGFLNGSTRAVLGRYCEECFFAADAAIVAATTGVGVATLSLVREVECCWLVRLSQQQRQNIASIPVRI